MKLIDKLHDLIEAEHSRFILWITVFIAAGIVFYFNLQDEPPFYLPIALTISGSIFVTALLLLKNRLKQIFLIPAIISLCFFAGIMFAQVRTNTVDSPYLEKSLPIQNISGKILEITQTPKGSKIILKDVYIPDIPQEKTPKLVSVSLKTYDPNLLNGQIISLRAGLFPPPAPSLAGGFDFSRYFYFKQIGAIGFGITPIKIIPQDANSQENFDVRFAEFRHKLSESIRSNFKEPGGSIAAAFITGETRTIPDEVNENMRTAGLYHLLAVSGMNLSIVAGLAFFSLRLILATIPAIALRIPIKKLAAILALIVSYIYLRVAGSPVSAERAFLMVTFIFVAILLDRDPNPMRSIAVSAFFIMMLKPESVLTASFQLSYSATAALIASYEWGIKRFTSNREGFGIRNIFLYFAAVILTSLVAWLATEPFIIYHFNQFSSYGLIANTIADPLVSFILMPLVIVGVLLMPFGLEAIAFSPMQYGVDLLIKIADKVAALPYAMLMLPPPSDLGFIIIILGGIWIYFWQSSLRWLGVIGVIAGMATSLNYVSPDIFINDDAKRIAARLDNGEIAMLKGRIGNATSDQWKRAALRKEYIEKDQVPLKCEKKDCRITLHGYRVALISNQEKLGEYCNSSDIIIANFAIDTAQKCSARLLIDKAKLQSLGSATIWFDNQDIKIKYAQTQRGNRPWVKQSSEGSEE